MFNAGAGYTSIPLGSFLGLYTEASPTDLPEGASPLCWDVDFVIGSVKMRPGKQTVFSFNGESVGPKGCTSGSNVTVTGAAWSNPGNITAHDGVYATFLPGNIVNTPSRPTGAASVFSSFGISWTNVANLSSSSSFTSVNLPAATLSGFQLTQTLIAQNFGFSVPSAANIVGVTVTITAFDSASATAVTISLASSGSQIGSGAITASLTNTPGLFTVGANNNTLGAMLSPAIVNDPSFGATIQVVRSTPAGATTVNVNNVQIVVFYTLSLSDYLEAKGFGFSLPSQPIIGIEIGVTGHFTGANFPTMTVQLLKNGVPVGVVKGCPLPINTDSRVLLGSQTDMWGTTLTFADLNSPGFGVAIQYTSGTAEEFVDFVDCTIFLASGSQNFTWFKTYAQRDGQVSTLAVDSNGVLWDEDVTNNPGVLSSVFTGLLSIYAKSTTFDDVEYIDFSNLIAGQDIPRQWNGTTLNRTSQVGPGAPPSVGFTSTTYPIVASPNGITQNAPVTAITALLWSIGPGNNSVAGNVITIYYGGGPTTPDPNIVVGNGVFLSGFGSVSGQSPNGTYIVNSVGTTPGHGGIIFNTFTVTALSVELAEQFPPAGGSAYQATLASVFTTIPVPNVQVGSQIAIAGAGVTAWNQSWNVLFTPNAAQLAITATSLTANVATYNFTLITGALPAAGEQVTVTLTDNGNGIFNVNNATILAATGTTFTVNLLSPNIASAAEAGQAIINGTEFQFDPAPALVGSATSPIFGNSGGGTLSVAGLLGAGSRECVVFFVTASGYLTAPSTPVTFTLTASANAIVVTNLPIGPPNVVARGLAFTGANGANFFTQEFPTTIVNNGVSTTYSSTWVNDNTTTQVTLTITDAVLLAGQAIDVQGFNLFELKELGPSLGNIAYANRMFHWGELNKITQFLNPTFDGGFLNPLGTHLVPLGWTHPTNQGPYLGTLNVSPVFGNSYYVQNSTGSPQATMGFIMQPAFQDFYNVPIILPNTLYSVRCTVRNPSGIAGGTFQIGLYSPGFNKFYGSLAIAINTMSTNMQIFSGPMLTTPFVTVPADLQLFVAATNVPATLVDFELDGFDVFPTVEPILTTALAGSYAGDFESFDQISGNFDASITNQQAVRACFTLFDTLYVVKTGSFISTNDNPSLEPAQWNQRTVSDFIGTPSINGVDYVDGGEAGEDYALIAGKSGLYIFNGGEPVPLSGDIRTLWNLINWKFGYSLWVRNDIVNKRILVGVPLPTPNQFLPNAPANSNPQTPNVVLAMSYKEVNTVSDLIERQTIRASSFTGKLIALDMSRKWTIWQIQAPYADFIQRQDTTTPVMLGNSMGTGKIYQLIDGLANDDGSPINMVYTTYAFTKPDTEQALQMGNVQKLYAYMTMNVTGNGNLLITALPNSITSPFAEALFPIQLQATATFDREIPLNEECNRLFMQFSTNAVGEFFEMSEMVMMMRQNVMFPVRGV